MDIKVQKYTFAELPVWIDDLTSLIKNIKFRQVICDAKDKELILFIGITGSGKSTCISYLLGANLEKVRMQGGKKCAALSTEQVFKRKYPEIGLKNYKSCTLYSEVFDDVSGLAFCDTAGFLDTRSEEEQVCASLSTQLAVQSAKGIRAIVIVIEWGIFDPKTSADLKELMSTLASLIKGPYEDIANSLIFLVNKVPGDVSKDDLTYLITEYKLELDKNISYIASKIHSRNLDLSQIEQLNRIALFIDLFKMQLEKRPENVVLIDVFDSGKNRENVLSLLSDKSCVITKERFNFNHFDKNRTRFDAALEMLVKNGLSLFEIYFELIAKKEELEKNKINSKASKDYYSAFNNFLAANDHAVFESMKTRFIELTKREIERLRREKKICGQKISGLRDNNDALLSERHSLDKPDSDLIYEDHYYDPVAPTLSDMEWSKIFFRSEKRFVYPVKVPFLYYEVLGNGSFDMLINNPVKGFCEVAYRSCFGEEGNAIFKVYAQKRFVPKNASRISQIDTEIPKNELKIEINDEKIKIIDIEIEELKVLLSATENTNFEENNIQKKETEKKFLEHFKSNELSNDIRGIRLESGVVSKQFDPSMIYLWQTYSENNQFNISVRCHAQPTKVLVERSCLSLIKLKDFPGFPKPGQGPVKILREKSSVLFYKIISLCGYAVTDIKRQKEKYSQELSVVEEKINDVNEKIAELKNQFELLQDLSRLLLFSHTLHDFEKKYIAYKESFESEIAFVLVNAKNSLDEINSFNIQSILLAVLQEELDAIQDKLEGIIRFTRLNSYFYEKAKAMLLVCKSFQAGVVLWVKLKAICYRWLDIVRLYPDKSEEISFILKSILLHIIYQPKLDEQVVGELLMAYTKHFGCEAQDLMGNTFLHAAVEIHNAYLVGVLLKLNILTTTKNAQGQTPFFLAVKNKCFQLAILILEYHKLNLQDNADLLVDSGGTNIYQYLLSYTVSCPKETLGEAFSVIQTLSSYGAKYPVEEALKVEKINPFVRLVKGLRLEFTLIVNNFDESIWEYKFLTSILKNLNAQEKQSCLLIGHSNVRLLDSLLSNYSQSPSIVEKVLELFVPKGALINREILSTCVLSGNYGVSIFLLSRWKAPIDVNFLLNDKRTLLSSAISIHDKQLVELLLNHKANCHQSVIYDLSVLMTDDQYYKPEDLVKLQEQLHLSKNLAPGKVSTGGSFFEAFAQVVNSLVGARLYSERNLREQCYHYFQKNPEMVEELRKAHFSEQMVNYEAIRDALPGTLQVEGVILCRKLGIEIVYVIEIIPDSDFEVELAFEHYAITQEGFSSIKRREISDGFPLLVTSNSFTRFIPMINQYSVSPLRLCVLENNIDAITLLLNSKQKFNIRETDQYGYTLFHTAALLGNLEILKILENRLINTEKCEWLLDGDKSGHTPLMISIKHDHLHCTEWFFEMIDKYSQTHSEKTAYRDRVLSVVDKQGLTTLMVAIESHSPDAVRSCLRQNPNSFWSNQEGDQAFQLALSDRQMPDNIVDNIRQSKMGHCIALVKSHTQMLLSHDTCHSDFLPRWMVQLEKVVNEPAYKQYQDKIMQASMSSLQTMSERLAVNISHAIREKYHSEDHKMLLQKNCQNSSFHAWDQTLRQAIDRTLQTVTEQLQIIKNYSDKSYKQITYFSEVKNDKHRAFTRALKEALRNYFYVSRALYEGKVLMNDEGFNAFKAAFNITSPFATEIASSLTTLNVGVIGSFVSAALELITRLKDAFYQCEAGRFVQAFGLCQPDAIEKYEKDISIDHDKLKAVAESLYKRYRDQIQQCTLSKEAEVSIRLSKTDGIYVLANVIADRIFQHMIKKGSIKVDDERTFKAQVADWWTTLGADKDIYYELSLMSLPERCIMAVLHESVGDDKDMHIRTDVWLKNGCKTEDIWMAGGILVKTGLKLERNPCELYVRKGGVTQESLHAKYGYCYVSESMLNLKEIEKRGFVKASLSQTDIFAAQLNEVEQKTVAPCFIL